MIWTPAHLSGLNEEQPPKCSSYPFITLDNSAFLAMLLFLLIIQEAIQSQREAVLERNEMIKLQRNKILKDKLKVSEQILLCIFLLFNHSDFWDTSACLGKSFKGDDMSYWLLTL